MPTEVPINEIPIDVPTEGPLIYLTGYLLPTDVPIYLILRILRYLKRYVPTDFSEVLMYVKSDLMMN